MTMPHGVCLLWNWHLLFWHISSDLLIGLSYYAIPIVLYKVRRELTNKLGRDMVLSFCAFILFCGLTHHIEILVIWYPIYKFQAVVKACTALLSVVTAFNFSRLSY